MSASTSTANNQLNPHFINIGIINIRDLHNSYKIPIATCISQLQNTHHIDYKLLRNSLRLKEYVDIINSAKNKIIYPNVTESVTNFVIFYNQLVRNFNSYIVQLETLFYDFNHNINQYIYINNEIKNKLFEYIIVIDNLELAKEKRASRVIPHYRNELKSVRNQLQDLIIDLYKISISNNINKIPIKKYNNSYKNNESEIEKPKSCLSCIGFRLSRGEREYKNRLPRRRAREAREAQEREAREREAREREREAREREAQEREAQEREAREREREAREREREAREREAREADAERKRKENEEAQTRRTENRELRNKQSKRATFQRLLLLPTEEKRAGLKTIFSTYNSTLFNGNVPDNFFNDIILILFPTNEQLGTKTLEKYRPFKCKQLLARKYHTNRGGTQEQARIMTEILDTFTD